MSETMREWFDRDGPNTVDGVHDLILDMGQQVLDFLGDDDVSVIISRDERGTGPCDVIFKVTIGDRLKAMHAGALARNNELSEERDKLKAQLLKCADTFEGYNEQHKMHEETVKNLQAAIDQRDKVIEGWQTRSDGLEATIEVREQGLREWAEIAEGLKADLEKSESALRTAEQAHATAQHQVAELSKALEPTRILAGLMQQSWQSTERTLKAALDMNETLTRERDEAREAYQELEARVRKIERRWE